MFYFVSCFSGDMFRIIFLTGLFIVLMVKPAFTQKKQARDTTYSRSNSSINSAASKVKYSLKKTRNDNEVADYYRELADELLKKGDTTKAEDYFQKALRFYKSSKNEDKSAEMMRQLAKIQESQKKYKDAISNYSAASQASGDKNYRSVNSNDASRLQNNSNPARQMQYIQQNVDLLEQDKNADSREKTQAYVQLAEVNTQLEKPEAAIENYNRALNSSQTNTLDDKAQIVNSLSDVYVSQKKYDKAIDLQKNLIAETEKVNDKQGKIKQLQQLATIYFKYGKLDEGYTALQEAYHISLKNGKLDEARESLQLLIAQYEKNNARDKIIPLYKSFVGGLDTLIKSDSSIVDARVFQVNEERIAQLEKERELKDELIIRKNRYNYVLAGSVLLLLVLLIIIAKAWNSIKKRNRKIALQSLRREMNPHFIFNSLNSVNQFIASNNELEANRFLTSYSNLMRNFMENSNKDFVSLTAELEQVRKYLELEKLRFADKFDFTVTLPADIDTDTVMVPNMLIQPNLENAIWHGLRYKETKGLLKLDFRRQNGRILVTIDDNGIGLKESCEIKTRNQKLHESRGLTNVEERIKLLNEIYKSGIQFEIIEKPGPESGVIVKIEW